MPCRTASAFPLFWARFTTLKRSGCSSCSDSRSRSVPSPLPSLTRTSSRSSPGTEKRRSSSTGRRCSSLKQGMTRARRDTAGDCGGWASIPQPDVVEHPLEPVRLHELRSCRKSERNAATGVFDHLHDEVVACANHVFELARSAVAKAQPYKLRRKAVHH